MKPVHRTPPGVKTAWADPEHMRLVEGTITEIIDPATGEIRQPRAAVRLHGPDPDDPWATGTGPVAPEAIEAGGVA